jgi:hypothetical protein
LIGDTKDESESTGELEGNDLMGMYYNLNKTTTAAAVKTPSGVGVSTLVALLDGYKIDSVLTNRIGLGIVADGAAFTNATDTLLVLWAKTTTDLNENVSFNFTLPSWFASSSSMVAAYQWDYASSSFPQFINGSQLTLSATPIVLDLQLYTEINDPFFGKNMTTAYPNPTSGKFVISYSALNTKDALVEVNDLMGVKVASENFDHNNQEFDLGRMPKGIYHVVVTSSSVIDNFKLVLK